MTANGSDLRPQSSSLIRPPRFPKNLETSEVSSTQSSSLSSQLVVPIATYEDIIVARQAVKTRMRDMGFSILAQTRMVTAVSELARNIIVHAESGRMTTDSVVEAGGRSGIACTFEDTGPGIADIDRALTAGFSTVRSMGLGLSGARQLCRSFDIQSTVGVGTRVWIAEWL